MYILLEVIEGKADVTALFGQMGRKILQQFFDNVRLRVSVKVINFSDSSMFYLSP